MLRKCPGCGSTVAFAQGRCPICQQPEPETIGTRREAKSGSTESGSSRRQGSETSVESRTFTQVVRGVGGVLLAAAAAVFLMRLTRLLPQGGDSSLHLLESVNLLVIFLAVPGYYLANWRRKTSRLVLWVAIPIAALLFVGSHLHQKQRTREIASIHRTACLNNLKAIEGTRNILFLERMRKGQSWTQQISLEEISDTIGKQLNCSAGGNYFLIGVNQMPLCSIPAHDLAWKQVAQSRRR